MAKASKPGNLPRPKSSAAPGARKIAPSAQGILKRKLAKGRTLAEFKPLSTAETELLRCSSMGLAAVISKRPPKSENASNNIRGSFIRFLALGGDDSAPVHEYGVKVVGGFISQELDLSFCTLKRPLVLERCQVQNPINMLYSKLPHLEIDGGSIPRLAIDGSTIDGDLLIGNGAVFGGLSLIGTTIRGELRLRDGIFNGVTRDAISADRIIVAGSVFIDGGFKAQGFVRFLGAEIGGSFAAAGGLISNPGRRALSMDNARIEGDVFF